MIAGHIVRLCLLATILFPAFGFSRPIELHPKNGHYLRWRGRPTILVTSAEHYGAVLNSAFDYKTYLRTLGEDRLNLTRTFTGAYCEPVGAFNITNNTLAPAAGKLLCPWARSETPGSAGPLTSSTAAAPAAGTRPSVSGRETTVCL